MKYFSILLIAVLMATMLSCQRKAGTGRKGFIKAGNFSVFYQRTGHGQPLVLLHAGLQDHTMWDDQVKALSDQFDIITPDLPFHGQTTGADSTILAADVVKALLDSLHITKVSISGLSMGASIAEDFIIAYPERVHKVMLISAGVKGLDKTHQMDTVSINAFSHFAQALDAKDTVEAARAFTRAWAEGVYRTGDSLKGPASQYVYRTTLANLRRHKAAGWPKLNDHPEAVDAIGKVNLPVMIIDGDKDLPAINASSKWLSQQIAGAKHVQIKNVAHMLNLEKPDEVNQLMRSFLK